VPASICMSSRSSSATGRVDGLVAPANAALSDSGMVGSRDPSPVDCFLQRRPAGCTLSAPFRRERQILSVAACQPNPRARGAGEPNQRRLATVRGESSQKLVGLPARTRQLTPQAARKGKPSSAAKQFAALAFSAGHSPTSQLSGIVSLMQPGTCERRPRERNFVARSAVTRVDLPAALRYGSAALKPR
jgi:hypothetical protein